jgi:hypothetical protein
VVKVSRSIPKLESGAKGRQFVDTSAKIEMTHTPSHSARSRRLANSGRVRNNAVREGKVIKLLLHILLSMTIVFLSTDVGLSEDLYYGGFDGAWEGKLKARALDLPTLDEKFATEFDLKLQIQDATVRVFAKPKGKDWEEAKKGEFRIAVHKTNAVIYASSSADDVYDKTGSGGWVETWNITATHKDANTLYVVWTRLVNNYMRPPWSEKIGASFLFSGFGEVVRSD